MELFWTKKMGKKALLVISDADIIWPNFIEKNLNLLHLQILNEIQKTAVHSGPENLKKSRKKTREIK